MATWYARNSATLQSALWATTPTGAGAANWGAQANGDTIDLNGCMMDDANTAAWTRASLVDSASTPGSLGNLYGTVTGICKASIGNVDGTIGTNQGLLSALYGVVTLNDTTGYIGSMNYGSTVTTNAGEIAELEGSVTTNAAAGLIDTIGQYGSSASVTANAGTINNIYNGTVVNAHGIISGIYGGNVGGYFAPSVPSLPYIGGGQVSLQCDVGTFAITTATSFTFNDSGGNVQITLNSPIILKGIGNSATINLTTYGSSIAGSTIFLTDPSQLAYVTATNNALASVQIGMQAGSQVLGSDFGFF